MFRKTELLQFFNFLEAQRFLLQHVASSKSGRYTAQVVHSIQLIILAAGKGARMNSELPKVLLPLAGKPLIAHLLEHVSKIPFARKPIIVVGHAAELVKKTLGSGFQYVYQQAQLGTGHAVKTAREFSKSTEGNIMVLYGDHPFVDAVTIQSIADAHVENGTPLTMATVEVPDFKEWRTAFNRYGRIIRDSEENITGIVEHKDASEMQRAITEVNPSYFCFRSNWLWKNLERLTNENAQHEYYLTDLVGMAEKDGHRITGVSIDPISALGANTKEELAVLEKIISLPKLP